MAIWYIAINGQQKGPLELDELLVAVRDNGPGNVHVYREGFTGWKLASEVADITRRLKLLPPSQTAEPAPSSQPSAPPTTLPTQTQNQPPPSAPTPSASPNLSRPAAAQGGNFIVRHWRGELPLWMSYWIVAILGQFFVSGVTLGIRGKVGESSASVVAVPVAFIFLAVATLWQMIGLWRSAVNYKIERRASGRAAFWGSVVQVLMLVWIAIWLFGAASLIRSML